MADILGRFTDEAIDAYYSFADCADGEKMIFGACRKIGGSGKDDKDFDSSKKTKQEAEVEAEGAKQKSSFENNKPFMKDGKRYGWAMKNGKKVAVEWGAIAGEKKVGPKKPKAKGKDAKPKDRDAAAKERRDRIRKLTAEQRDTMRAELLKRVKDADEAKKAIEDMDEAMKGG